MTTGVYADSKNNPKFPHPTPFPPPLQLGVLFLPTLRLHPKSSTPFSCTPPPPSPRTTRTTPHPPPPKPLARCRPEGEGQEAEGRVGREVTVTFVKKWADVNVGEEEEEGGAVIEMPLPYRLPPPKYGESGVNSGSVGGRGRRMQISAREFVMFCHCSSLFFSKWCPQERGGRGGCSIF